MLEISSLACRGIGLFAPLLIALSVQAQMNIDSLRSIAHDRTEPDSVRFSAWYNMVWDGYLFNAPDSAFMLAEGLRHEARAKGNKTYEARSSELIAATWYVRGDLRTALVHYDTALVMHRAAKDEDGTADVLTNMASMWSFLGERDLALKLYDEGLRIHEEIRDSVSIANDLNAIGAVHKARGDHGKAVDLFTRALHMQEALRNERGIATGRANLGSTLNEQGEYSSALIHFREALKIAEHLNDQHMVGKDLEEIGSCLELLNDTASAMVHYTKSLRVREAIEDRHGTVNVNNRIANLLLEQGQAEQAMKVFQSTAKLAREEELPWGLGYALVGQSKCLLVTGRNSEALTAAQQATAAAVESDDLSLRRDAADVTQQALRSLGRWKEALDAYTTMIALNDSIMREDNQRAVLRNEYAYTYQKQAIADSLESATEKQQERLRSDRREADERSRRNVALSVAALVAVLALSIWQRARILRRTNAKILSAQEKLLESERAREASEVRTRIARDVHDQLGSDLTKLVMLSTEAKAIAQEDMAALPVIANDIERIAGEANRSLGDIVWAIDPHHDSLAGLTDRVRTHCERMLKWSKVEHTVDCVHEGPDRTLDPATKRDIYLIMREALNNAIKYAKARHIHVRFHTDTHHIAMLVADDGKGLDTLLSGGNGLANMRHRAERIGARFDLDGSKGTSVRLDLQLED